MPMTHVTRPGKNAVLNSNPQPWRAMNNPKQVQEELSEEYEEAHNYNQANGFQRAKVTVMRAGGMPSKPAQDPRKVELEKIKEDLESKLKRVNEINLEKVIEKDNYLYFITKDGKDKPLDSFFKMQVPDRKLKVKDDQIQNLKSLLLRHHRRSGDESQFG